eukprot:gnl/Ergobibamus_cyprinoides/3843.p1 GENE.gnl/Ergobibamus_cyprinoides/3843~~gnl/Ergobibamus_cyprinoides/3843.p1  ORF type:complete len:201 (+),score=31.43 gnl/Ergobibamus_cyprinoides/3843:398-1000(+)
MTMAQTSSERDMNARMAASTFSGARHVAALEDDDAFSDADSTPELAVVPRRHSEAPGPNKASLRAYSSPSPQHVAQQAQQDRHGHLALSSLTQTTFSKAAGGMSSFSSLPRTGSFAQRPTLPLSQRLASTRISQKHLALAADQPTPPADFAGSAQGSESPIGSPGPDETGMRPGESVLSYIQRQRTSLTRTRRMIDNTSV